MTFSKSTPPKKRSFFGGAKLFWIKSSIFESGRYKKFRQDFGAERTLSATFRPISAENPELKFQEYCFFEHYKANLGTFFFQNKTLVQNQSKMAKNDFSELLWILKII